MTEEQQLAITVARSRPLDGPLPPGFDVETLPVYRAPISHPNMTVNPRSAVSSSAPEHDGAVGEAVTAGVNDAVPRAVLSAVAHPIAVASTPETQTCHWATCTKTFSGFNAPTFLCLHLTNEHVERPVIDPNCKWINCAYSNKTRRFLVSHVGTHVPDYKLLVCDECGRGFQQPAHLVRHQGTHR
ncbi:hypothetical protein M436DRAFT_86000 [Aureobasidium namibiae CBS 147.97]|uniref:pH-response transcription factor pacC/RIM101 n=1 Tax=Aureobasidium namibiae CBS 147.97 TaxID=1043004 RepID=A0A074X2G7_9PEZI